MLRPLLLLRIPRSTMIRTHSCSQRSRPSSTTAARPCCSPPTCCVSSPLRTRWGFPTSSPIGWPLCWPPTASNQHLPSGTAHRTGLPAQRLSGRLGSVPVGRARRRRRLSRRSHLHAGPADRRRAGRPRSSTEADLRDEDAGVPDLESSRDTSWLRSGWVCRGPPPTRSHIVQYRPHDRPRDVRNTA